MCGNAEGAGGEILGECYLKSRLKLLLFRGCRGDSVEVIPVLNLSLTFIRSIVRLPYSYDSLFSIESIPSSPICLHPYP